MTLAVMPNLALLGLSEDERHLVTRLENMRSVMLPELQLRDAYYRGDQLIRDLGIAIPPSVRGLATVVGWPQVAVDALDERLDVQGFRFAGQTDGDDTLNGVWQANNLDEESQLGHLDALIHRKSFIVGGEREDGSPLITVESALDMSSLWDPRWKALQAAWRIYGGDEFGRHRQATLYVIGQTIHLAQNDSGEWELDNDNYADARDIHGWDELPVAQLVNRARISERDGHSEITSAVMSLTDSACRTLLGMEVGREFFGAPQRWALNADESAFQNPDGTPRPAWTTYIGRYLALTAGDEQAAPPQVGQFPSNDPTAFTKILDSLTERFAAVSRLPAYMLGQTTQNPASADAIRSAENGLIRRAERRQQAFSGAWEAAMRFALRIMNGGTMPAGADRIEVDWVPAKTPTPAADTDAVSKQVDSGLMPARSDVALSRLGYSQQERKRIAQEFLLPENMAAEFVDAVAKAVEARAARVANAAANTEVQATTPAAPAAPA